LPFSRAYTMLVLRTSLGRCFYKRARNHADTESNRSPDGQALMLSSSDGYCSIVVFDMAELGTVHPTQQHHRQLAAIAQSHSGPSAHYVPSASSTPVPHSPAVSTMRQYSPAPTRSEREGSVASSIALPPSQTIPFSLHGPTHPPSSASSSTEPSVQLPTPDESDRESSKVFGGAKSESGSSVAGTAPSVPGVDAGTKREGGETEAPKKKRRIALTQVIE
jgi:chromatin assembly factor 1 subunit B